MSTFNTVTSINQAQHSGLIKRVASSVVAKRIPDSPPSPLFSYKLKPAEIKIQLNTHLCPSSYFILMSGSERPSMRLHWEITKPICNPQEERGESAWDPFLL